MAVIPDFRSATLIAFLKQNVEAGSTVYTDGLKSFTGLPEAGFQHVPRSQPLRIELRQGAKSAVPLADRAIGNLQQWLIGTYHGVSRDQLQVYLDEFVVRHNRRRQPMGPRSRPCSALEPGANLQLINKYAAPWTFPLVRRRPTPRYCVLLKQPDKQKLANASLLNSPELRFVCEDVRSGVNEGRVVQGMSLVRDGSASRPEREDFEHGSAGTSDGELSWEARKGINRC